MLSHTQLGDLVDDVFGARAIIRAILTVALDDDTVLPAWTTTATTYYDTLARYVETSDPTVRQAIEHVVSTIRASYRNHREHEYHVSRVPVTKRQDDVVYDRLHEDCCVCHTSLNGIARVSRLKPLDTSRDVCGHFVHTACLAKLRPDAEGHIRCPLCRADMGSRPLCTYSDFENTRPLF